MKGDEDRLPPATIAPPPLLHSNRLVNAESHDRLSSISSSLSQPSLPDIHNPALFDEQTHDTLLNEEFPIFRGDPSLDIDILMDVEEAGADFSSPAAIRRSLRHQAKMQHASPLENFNTLLLDPNATAHHTTHSKQPPPPAPFIQRSQLGGDAVDKNQRKNAILTNLNQSPSRPGTPAYSSTRMNTTSSMSDLVKAIESPKMKPQRPFPLKDAKSQHHPPIHPSPGYVESSKKLAPSFDARSFSSDTTENVFATPGLAHEETLELFRMAHTQHLTEMHALFAMEKKLHDATPATMRDYLFSLDPILQKQYRKISSLRQRITDSIHAGQI